MPGQKDEVHLEFLLSRQVVDKNGKKVGRIEEVRAEEQDNGWIVKAYLLGPAALLERLSVASVGARLGRFFTGKGKSYRVPWDKLDLSDPEHPKLTCAADELKDAEEVEESK